MNPREYNHGDMMWQPNTPTTPAETPRAPRPRRKRKSTNTNSSTPNTGMNSTSSKKKSPSGAGFTLATQDVMVVGEPSLMGGEFGDEDERLITRLENTQYDASNGVGDDGDFGNSPMSGSPSLWSADRKPNQEDSTGD